MCPYPPASVVILNHNNGEFLGRCLLSVLSTEYPNFEVILVDNGSTDDSVELVRRQFGNEPRLKIIQDSKNLGASVGRNTGSKHATGKYLAFLDPDTKVDGNWLKEAVTLMEGHPSVAAVQCKLLLLSNPSRIDYVGDFISQFGFLVQRVPLGALDSDALQKRAVIFGVKSAGMVANKLVLQKIGVFDEDYFIYMEETDLCWRVWLSGSQVEYCPTSIVYHDFGQLSKLSSERAKFLSKYHGTKNYVTTILKNADGTTLSRIIPIHIVFWMGIAIWHFGRRRTREGIWISRGIIYNLRNFRSIWRKRTMVQRYIRKVSDNTILPQVMVRVSPTYLYWKATHEGSGWNL